jgi:pyruvate-formate lyase-activating enzyme
MSNLPRGVSRNQYTLVHMKIFFRAVRSGKVTFRKILNVLRCNLAYVLKLKSSGPGPYMVSIELWNECNADCVFCRDAKGVIYDVNPNGVGTIEKGRMPSEMAKDIILQLKDHLLVAVLYTNGEPLMYKELAEVIRFATDHGVATIIASNGILLDEKRSRAILEAGLDFIKIQLSGFHQETYSVQIRKGNVEHLKENIRNFIRLRNEGRYGTVVLIDYIYYNYNKHEYPLVKKFCEELGLMLNIRPGNPKHGLESKEPPLSTEPLPLAVSCDWLWKGMQVNYNGDVLQCCEAVVWSKPPVYEKFVPQKSRLLKVWNGPQAVETRRKINEEGRGSMPMCAGCLRKGISFKW